MIDPKTILDVVQTIPVLTKIIKIVRKDGKPLLSMKHLVVKSDLVTEEILRGRFKSLYEELRARRVYLAQNDVLFSLREIHRRHVVANCYKSWEHTPVSDRRDKNSNMFEKTITAKELINLSKKYDANVTGAIIGNQIVDPNAFCKLTYLWEECAEGVSESIEFRPIWFVLLWVENLSDDPIEVGQYSGSMYYPNTGLEYRELASREGENYKTDIPFNVLEKGESILIPEYILLAPMDSYVGETSQKLKYDELGLVFDFLYAFTQSRRKEGFHLIGPSLTVQAIRVGKGFEKVHEFAIENTLTLSEVLECGSCPYVIGWQKGKFKYVKDILSSGREKVNIRDYEFIVISEIEDEVTFLRAVTMGNDMSQTRTLLNTLLNKGDSIVLDNVAKHYTHMIVEGSFSPKDRTNNNEFIVAHKCQNLRRHISELAAKAGTLTVDGKAFLSFSVSALHQEDNCSRFPAKHRP